jgi:hypothetical protein
MAERKRLVGRRPAKPPSRPQGCNAEHRSDVHYAILMLDRGLRPISPSNFSSCIERVAVARNNPWGKELETCAFCGPAGLNEQTRINQRCGVLSGTGHEADRACRRG